MKLTSIALLVSTLSLTGCSLMALSDAPVAATQNSSSAQQTFSERKILQRGQLDNGLKYIVAPNPEAGKRVSVQLIVHSGSLDEADDQLGIAHLVEHMAFNGTEDFPGNSMIEHFKTLGMVFGRDVNAMTEQHSTSYYLNLPNNSDTMLNEAFHILSQQAFAQTFDSLELENERPIIEEEWRRTLGMVARLGTSTRNIMLGDNYYAKRNPIGDMDLVRNVGAQRIKDFWLTWYHPNNMTLLVVGDVDEADISPLLENYFADVPAQALPPRVKDTLPLPNTLTVSHVADPEIVTEVVSISFRGEQAAALSPATLKQQLLNSLAMDMLGRRLQQMYQTEGQHLSRVVAGDQNLIPGYNNNRIMGITKETDYAKGYEELFNHISMFKHYGFSEVDLIVAKADALEFEKRAAKRAQKPTNRQLLMEMFGQLRLDYPLIDPQVRSEQTQTILSQISLDEVNQYFSQMVATRSPVAITQLQQDNLQYLPSEREVTQLWQHALANPPKLVQNETKIKPLFTQQLTAVEPIAQQQVEDTHIWQFDNGASVWFKYSDKSKQNLLLSWQGVGGSQHLAADKLRAVQLTGRTMPSFGYGGLTEPELAVANAGKTVRLMPYIGDLEHGITGSTTAEDLEYFLQNMYLMMLEPQVNSDIWQARKNMLLKGLSQEVKSADRQYDEAIARIRYANDPSLLPMTTQEVEPIEVEDMLAIWQQHFSDASGRQLVIVGNAPVEQVKLLVSRYIGNLPKGRAKADATLPKLWTGEHNVNIRAGIEPKGATGWYFNVDHPYSLNAERQASLVSRIVRTRLMQAIRESAGGTYSPSFGMKLDRERQQLYGNLSYGHQPERGDELLAVAQQVFEQLLEQGITSDELSQVKQQQRNSYAEDNISDKLRFGWLRNSARANQVSNDPVGYLQWLETVQVAELNALLSKALTSPNTIDARMGPAQETAN